MTKTNSPQNDEILSTLSVRIQNTLHREGITTDEGVRQFLKHKPMSYLLRHQNFGQTSAKQLAAAYGLWRGAIESPKVNLFDSIAKELGKALAEELEANQNSLFWESVEETLHSIIHEVGTQGEPMNGAMIIPGEDGRKMEVYVRLFGGSEPIVLEMRPPNFASVCGEEERLSDGQLEELKMETEAYQSVVSMIQSEIDRAQKIIDRHEKPHA